MNDEQRTGKLGLAHMTTLTVTLKLTPQTTGNYDWAEHEGPVKEHTFHKPTNIAIRYHLLNKGLNTMATKKSTTDIAEETAEIELTLEQALEMRLDEAVGPAIEEALDKDPTFYRPFAKKTDKELQFEDEKCSAASVIAKMKNEAPDPQIEATRRDIMREKKLREAKA